MGGQFAAHTRQHARRVAESACAPFRDLLPPDREFLDLHEYQIALGDELDRRDAELTAIDDRHARQLQRDRELREQRDRLTVRLRVELFQVRDTVEGHFGDGASRSLFQEDPPRLPTDAVALLQVSQRIHHSLTDPGFDLQPQQSGVVVNPVMLASSFEETMNQLAATLVQLRDSESVTRHTQSLKEAALARTEVFHGRVARFCEAFYDLSGHHGLASRLRRSSHVRPPSGEAGSEGDAEAAESGEAASAESAEAATGAAEAAATAESGEEAATEEAAS
jgi:hypothetical protein